MRSLLKTFLFRKFSSIFRFSKLFSFTFGPTYRISFWYSLSDKCLQTFFIYLTSGSLTNLHQGLKTEFSLFYQQRLSTVLVLTFRLTENPKTVTYWYSKIMKSKLPVLQTRRLEVFHQYLTAKISSANNLESRNSLILFFLPEAPREVEFAKFSISFETDNPHRLTNRRIGSFFF